MHPAVVPSELWGTRLPAEAPGEGEEGAAGAAGEEQGEWAAQEAAPTVPAVVEMDSCVLRKASNRSLSETCHYRAAAKRPPRIGL